MSASGWEYDPRSRAGTRCLALPGGPLLTSPGSDRQSDSVSNKLRRQKKKKEKKKQLLSLK